MIIPFEAKFALRLAQAARSRRVHPVRVLRKAIMDLMTKLPEMSDDALANLRTNAERLRHSGTSRQQADATLLLPAVEAELGARRQARLKAVRAAVANPRPQRRRVAKQPLRGAAEE